MKKFTFIFLLKRLLSIIISLNLCIVSVSALHAQQYFLAPPHLAHIVTYSPEKETKPKMLNVNNLSAERLLAHLKKLDALNDLKPKILKDLAEWIVKHKKYKNRAELIEKLTQTRIQGFKKHHQLAVANSLKVGISRRNFIVGLAAAAGIPTGFLVAKKISEIFSPRDWTDVLNNIETEKRKVNQKLTQQFLETYPEEKGFIKQINRNKNIVFADYAAEAYKDLMNTPTKNWEIQGIVDSFRKRPELIMNMNSTRESFRQVKQIVRNKRIPGMIEKIMQISNMKQQNNGLNDFATMTIDYIAFKYAIRALVIIQFGREEGGLPHRLPYYGKPKSTISTSEYAFVDLATGTNFEVFLQDILEYSPKRPIILTDTSPYVIRFWRTVSQILALDNIQILDLDIRTISRKTIPLKVGTIRLQNVAPWVNDLSEEWVEQIFDLVEPGGQIILSHAMENLSKKGWSSPQPMTFSELLDVVMLQDKDNTKLSINLFQVVQKQLNKWDVFAGHVGEDGYFKRNQSGYLTYDGKMPKVYNTVIVFQKLTKPRLSLDSIKPQPVLASSQEAYSSKSIETSL